MKQGTATVTVTAQDPAGLTASQTFRVTVPNRPPVVTDTVPALELFRGDTAAIELSAHFSDPDGDTLTFGAETTDGGVVTVSISADSLTAMAMSQGMAGLIVIAQDPAGLTAMQTFAVTVPNRAPILTSPISGVEFFAGGSLVIDLSAHFTDPDRDALTFAAGTSDEDVASAAVSGDTLSIKGLASGEAEITVTARDPMGLLVSEGMSVVVVADHQRKVLAALYDAAGGSNWGHSENWLTNAPLEDWHGVAVDADGFITGLDLRRNRLLGGLPGELGSLVRLRRLDLSYNDLSGPIPLEIANFAHLLELNLSNNRFTGPIPAELGGLDNLTQLILSRNRLTGGIPSELGQLANLKELWLHTNRLSGSIPPELGSLANLERMLLQSADLTGPIPPELGLLVKLWEMKLHENSLTGPVPSELGGLAELRQLWLSNNNLTGPLPRSLLNIDLRVLRLSRNPGLCVPGLEAFVTWLQPQNLGEGLSFCNEPDIQGLELLYEATGGGDWKNSAGWLDGVVLDRWYGIGTDSLGRVRSLELSGNGLVGRLPSTLGQSFEHVRELRIADNEIAGPLPRSLVHVPLRELRYADTDLCVPSEPSFQAWLATIQSHLGTGVQCDPLSERQILTTLYEASGGANWIRSDNWLTDAPLEDWYGVRVDAAGRVISLRLIDNGLTDLVPPELGSLASLEDLQLSANGLTGQIPPELGNLSKVTRLILDSNRLTGAIPPELGSLADLKDLVLSNNRLTGSIPSEVGDLGNLTTLLLGVNDLTGPIPSELGNLAKLTILDIPINDLTGPIPPELGSLANLESLELSRNRLTGPIPSELASLASLNFLYLSDNHLTGPIPSELGRLARLNLLNLSGNQLTGPIPPALGSLTSLTSLQLFDNNLMGPIPSELGLLAGVQYVALASNDLTGPIPSEFGELARLRELDFSNNSDLSGPLPGSLTNLRLLNALLTAATNLCVPADRKLLDWLVRVEKQRVRRCAGGGTKVYLSQAVQSREYPVPLLADEEALLRVFVTANQATDVAIPTVEARFYVNGNETYAVEIPSPGQPIPTEVDESSLVTSANATIPGWVLRPGLETVVEIDPEGSVDPSLGVTRRIPETGRLALDVQRMPSLQLTLIPFVSEEDPDSAIVEIVPAIASDPHNHELLLPTRTLLPVADLDVIAHAPVLTSAENIYQLFAETRAIYALEGARGHYKGMKSGSRDGGPAGLASVGGNVSFSFPHAPTMAHELGHNMGLLHAPCGGAGSLDPGFPWPDGRIGAWGYDFGDGGRLVDPSTPDLMSYCGPKWIGDYNFANALRHRLMVEGDGNARARSSDVQTLLLWGGVDAEGALFLEPAFVVDAAPVLPSPGGDYRLEGRATSGRQLFSLGFDMLEVADGEEVGAFAFTVPVQPEWAGALATITLSGSDGSYTLDRESDRPMAILLDPHTGQVHGILRDLPEGSRTQADAGIVSAHDGVVVLISGGIPDAIQWNR